MNRLINMILRRLINTGIDKGVDAYVSRKGRDPETPQTPEQRRQAREAAKRMKQTARMTRRIGRM